MQLPQIVEIRRHGTVVAVVALDEDRGRIRAVDAGGRECSFPAPRVLCETGVVPASADPAAAAQEAARYERQQVIAADGIDVGELWARAHPTLQTASLQQLAALTTPEPSGVDAAAVLRAIVADGRRFRVRASDVEVLGAAQVEAAEQRRLQEIRRAEVRGATVRWLRGEADSAPAEAEDLVDALRRYAAQPDQPPARDPAAVLLREAGLEATPAEACRVLQRRGIFEPDENLLLIRHGLDSDFPPEVLQAAERFAASGPEPSSRRDLRDWPTVSIDEEGTTEVDDALSIRPLDGGGARVGIHLADPGAFFAPGSAVDREARARQTTLYLPDRKRLMLPASLSEGAASLTSGLERPALTVLVEFDADGRQTGAEIFRSLVVVDRAVGYAEADREIERGGELSLLAELAERSRRRRIAAGAVETESESFTPVVGPDGAVELRRSSDASGARKTVAEFMVRANRIVARYCRDHRIPVPYRRQELREPLPEGLDLSDPHGVFLATRCLGKAWADLRPGRHHGLALDPYVQVTSPLRRYLDLVSQRQLTAHLASQAPPLDEEGIVEQIREARPVLSKAQRVSAGSRDYWLLRWLQGRVGRVVEAVVQKKQRRGVRLELIESKYRVTWRPPRHVRAGERLMLRVEAVDPLAGKVELALAE